VLIQIKDEQKKEELIIYEIKQSKETSGGQHKHWTGFHLCKCFKTVCEAK